MATKVRQQKYKVNPTLSNVSRLFTLSLQYLQVLAVVCPRDPAHHRPGIPHNYNSVSDTVLCRPNTVAAGTVSRLVSYQLSYFKLLFHGASNSSAE